MNIIVFTYSITRVAGGVFDAVRNLFINPFFKGCNITIYSYTDKYTSEDISQWGKLPIVLFQPRYMLYSRKAKKELLKAQTDVLHMEALWRYPHLLMAIWKKKRKEPIVCSPHGMLDPYIIHTQGKLKRFVSKIFFQKGLDAVDCYHALCRKELEDIRAYGLKQPVAIIPNGINLPQNNVIYKRNDEKRHLLYLGRLHQKKGVDLLLKAIAQINADNSELLSNWHVDLVGWDHENCKIELEKIVKEQQLEELVTFHGGLFGEDKLRMYATSDAYILPSHGEGLPMTVLEAWSWKLPVIMTPQCNIPEGFESDAAIRIEDNVLSVKEGLILLLKMDDEQRKEMGKRGYELVLEKFTWDSSAKKMIELYTWLLGKGDRPDFVFT